MTSLADTLPDDPATLKAIRGQDPEGRLAARQERSRQVLEDLEPWLRSRLETISQKPKLAEAIRYALLRWGADPLPR